MFYFKVYKNEWNCEQIFTGVGGGDEFMAELHLKQPGITYSACVPFTRNKKRIEKFMQTGYTDFIYRNELDKACFQHDVA